MLMNIDDQLLTAEENLHIIHNIEKRLHIIEHEIDVVEHNLRQQQRRMKEELADVERLEKNGVKSLFSKVLGDIQTELERERQEYLQEVLTYNSMVDELEVLQYEKELLGAKVQKKLELSKHYELLLATKEKNILLSHPSLASKLKIIDGQIIVNKKILVETDEAIASGHDVLKQLGIMIGYLKYVKQWGIYRMQGKGRYSSYEKKGYIDKAIKQVAVIQVKFNIFEKELKDLYPDFKLNLDAYQFRTFVENFYDGLITDWIIVKQLQVAMHNNVDASHKVKRLMATLEQEKHNISTRIQAKLNERITYLKNVDTSK